MRYFYILVFLFLFFTSPVTWANNDDCSELVDSSFVIKDCKTTTLIGKTYPIIGLTEELATEIKQSRIKKAVETGKPVFFHDKRNTISIFPPKILVTTSTISLVDDELKITKVESQKSDLVTIIIIVAVTAMTIVSGFFDKISFNPMIRINSRDLLAGTSSGVLFAILTNMYTGFVLQGISLVAAILLATLITIIFWKTSKNHEFNFRYIIVSYITVVGSPTIVAVEWIGFLLLMMMLEYIIIFFRYQREQARAALN